MLQAKEVKALAERLARAEALVAAGAVKPITGLPEHFAVVNGSGDSLYLVHLRADGTACCSCPDYVERQSKVDQPCKHILSSEHYAAAPKAASEPKTAKRTKTDAPQEDARPVIDGAAALARLQGDDDAGDPWNAPA